SRSCRGELCPDPRRLSHLPGESVRPRLRHPTRRRTLRRHPGTPVDRSASQVTREPRVFPLAMVATSQYGVGAHSGSEVLCQRFCTIHQRLLKVRMKTWPLEITSEELVDSPGPSEFVRRTSNFGFAASTSVSPLFMSR